MLINVNVKTIHINVTSIHIIVASNIFQTLSSWAYHCITSNITLSLRYLIIKEVSLVGVVSTLCYSCVNHVNHLKTRGGSPCQRPSLNRLCASWISWDISEGFCLLPGGSWALCWTTPHDPEPEEPDQMTGKACTTTESTKLCRTPGSQSIGGG